MFQCMGGSGITRWNLEFLAGCACVVAQRRLADVGRTAWSPGSCGDRFRQRGHGFTVPFVVRLLFREDSVRRAYGQGSRCMSNCFVCCWFVAHTCLCAQFPALSFLSCSKSTQAQNVPLCSVIAQTRDQELSPGVWRGGSHVQCVVLLCASSRCNMRSSVWKSSASSGDMHFRPIGIINLSICPRWSSWEARYQRQYDRALFLYCSLLSLGSADCSLLSVSLTRSPSDFVNTIVCCTLSLRVVPLPR